MITIAGSRSARYYSKIVPFTLKVHGHRLAVHSDEHSVIHMTTRHSGLFSPRPGCLLGHTVRYEAVVDSTNRLARELATGGAAAGLVVLADSQTAGRGRHGRTWESAPGQNLLMSIVLRPDEPVSAWGRYVMMAGLAVCRVVEEIEPTANVVLKWPNDILVDGKKCGGILMEHASGALVLGLGLNVNQTGFPDESRVSLALVVGRPLDRGHVLDVVLRHLETCMGLQAEDVIGQYSERLHHAGRELTIRSLEGRTPVTGAFLGVTSEGALRLRVNGRVETFHAGDVTMATP